MNRTLFDMLISRPFCFVFFFLICFLNLPLFSQNINSVQTNKNTTFLVPRIEQGPCAVPIPPDEKSDCGYLIVYEDRQANKGKTIRLPFIIMRSGSATPLADPILFTSGGPGGSSLGQVRNRRYIPYLKNRDYILFEQRGTRYSSPSLECPEVNEARLESAKQNRSKPASAEAELKAVRSCREKLQSGGINLSAYNSWAIAALPDWCFISEEL